MADVEDTKLNSFDRLLVASSIAVNVPRTLGPRNLEYG
jgi:hypothetical protein